MAQLPGEKPTLVAKRCLVTGGSRNLGRAICECFAEAGARVAFTFRSGADRAEETRRILESAGADVLLFQGSADDSAHVERTVDAVVAAWGGIDVLVNNAAICPPLPTALLEEADWDHVMSVNVKGPYLFARSVLRSMIRARRGHILNVGSFGAERLVRAPVHYAASKAALLAFTRSLAQEVGRYGIAVNYLAPGLLDSGLSKSLGETRLAEMIEQSALRRPAKPGEIARFATWLVSDANSFMTGAKVVVDGGR